MKLRILTVAAAGVLALSLAACQKKEEAPAAPAAPPAGQPLAARMRPRRLSEIAGQPHLTDPGSLLPRLVASNRFGSLLFYGPRAAERRALPRQSRARPAVDSCGSTR